MSGGRLSGRGASLLIQRWSIAAGQSRHVGHWGEFQDLRLRTLLQTDHIIVNIIQINVASLSVYWVRACKIKHYTEGEFSGIFFLAGGGNLRFQNGNSRWPCIYCIRWKTLMCIRHVIVSSINLKTYIIPHLELYVLKIWLKKEIMHWPQYVSQCCIYAVKTQDKTSVYFNVAAKKLD